MAPSRHQTDLQRACIAFIASLRQPAAHHAVYGQTRIDSAGESEECIVIHRHPNAPQEFQAKIMPAAFNGYPVIEQDWPTSDL